MIEPRREPDRCVSSERADGSVFSRKSAGWLSSFEGAKVMPGDTLANTFQKQLRRWLTAGVGQT